MNKFMPSLQELLVKGLINDKIETVRIFPAVSGMAKTIRIHHGAIMVRPDGSSETLETVKVTLWPNGAIMAEHQ